MSAVALPRLMLRRRRRRRHRPEFGDLFALFGFTTSVLFALQDVRDGDLFWAASQMLFAVGWWVTPNLSWWLIGRRAGHPPYRGVGRILYRWFIGDPDD